jgi:hypothetical protein
MKYIRRHDSTLPHDSNLQQVGGITLHLQEVCFQIGHTYSKIAKFALDLNM